MNELQQRNYQNLIKSFVLRNLNYFKYKIGKENITLELDLNKIKEDKEVYSNLIDKPEETIQLLESFSYELLKKDVRIRFVSPSKELFKQVEDLRCKDLKKFIVARGFLTYVGAVKPRVVSAKFECPKCGTVTSVLQIDERFRELSRCSCGRKSWFNELGKELIDYQRAVLSDKKNNFEINVFLKEDLTFPNKKISSLMGKMVEVIGVFTELPTKLASGELSNVLEWGLDANNIYPVKNGSISK